MRYFIVLLFVFLAGCADTGGPSTEPAPTKEPTPRPGVAAVYERIESLTDCRALQAEFDQAATNGQRARAAGNLEQSRISTAYMEAADKRMRELKC
jgi:hypothetical protein